MFQLTSRIVAGVALVACVAVLVTAEPAKPIDRAEQWKKVEAAVNKGLPKTAIAELDPIIADALGSKAYPEATLAIARKIALEGTIQGNKPQERITRMKAEIAKAPKAMVPVMDALLAHWYWHYFQQNKWRIVRRTATAAAPSDDFTTWDLKRLFAEIDKQFTKALAAEQELRNTKIGDYDALLERGSIPDEYRPTLYDFIAHEALSFYTSGEQAGAKAQDEFEFPASSPALGSVNDFLQWKPQTTDTDSPKLKAILLFQKLLAFHAAGKNRSAYLDVDLARLQFGHAASFGEDKNDLYLKALAAFAEDNAKHEAMALARHRHAVVLNGMGEHVAARDVALAGANAFPQSQGGLLCHNLVKSIESRSVNVVAERVWNDPAPQLRVSYKNLQKLHFRAVPMDWEGRLGRDRWRPEYLTANDHEELAKRDPAKAWSVNLPATADYRTRTEDIDAPKDLKPGYYFIVASPKEDFSQADNVLSFAEVWVSDLAMVMRNDYRHGRVGGFVLDAKSGEPRAGAAIKTWTRQNDGTLKPGPETKTDADGVFDVKGDQRSYFVLASHDGHRLASFNEYANHVQGDNDRNHNHTILFTDRALYRPGQTIHFKGICLAADQRADDYKVLPDRRVEVVFSDPNGKEVARQAVVSNAFGSVSGSFTAPRDRLAGTMHLTVPGDHSAHAHFNVEEYKRPKFVTTVDPPKEGVKLAGDVTVVGKAMSYTGAAINGGKVRWRVTREVRWPVWFHNCCWWRIPPHRGAAQEIAHGNAMTEGDGTFTVTFNAKPDLTVPEKDEPTFVFTVHADVTDTTGETRSASKSVELGYRALRATLGCADWQTVGTPVKLNVLTATLDGVGESAQGTVVIHRLKSPEKVARPSLFGRIDPPRKKGEEPTPTVDPADPRTWPLGDDVASIPFASDKDGKQELTAKLDAGFHRATLTTKDRFGKPVTAQHFIRVLNPADAKLALKVPHLFDAPKWSLEPGESFTALWGTGYDQGRAYIEVEHRGKKLQSFWTDANKTQVKVDQAVTEAMRGGFHVRVTHVRENRGYIENRYVEVPWSNKDLTVSWEHFVSKLEPGRKETFTAVVKGPKASKATAEMVATLYDASLDAYLPHHWLRKFNVFRHDHHYLHAQFENVARHLQHFRGHWNEGYKHVDFRHRKFPDSIAANMWGYMYYEGAGGMMPPGAPRPASAAPREEAKADGPADAKKAEAGDKQNNAADDGAPAAGPDLSGVAARKNLSELAFFLPHLTTGDDGSVRLEFTMPEALTKWKFLGFAHDKDLRSGFLDGELVTAKDLMVQPNPPRFLRERDQLEFSVKVSNQSPARQAGKVRLSFTDLQTSASIDAKLGNTSLDQPFDIEPGSSKSFFWRITVPDDQGPIAYKAVGASDKFSDGEEGMVPVLSRRVLVTESIPLPIRGAGTKTFDFAKLRQSAGSDTIKHQSFTVQMCSQPAWYAVMALPYLMEYPHECAEQTFNRLYANSLARHIAGSDPKIRKVFDQWRGTDALDSPLTKNQDLKAVTLEETPWLRDAMKESAARRNVGILFDDNRLNDEMGRALTKLAQMQHADGMWPWFPGGPPNEYMTLYITTGFGRLRHLGVTLDQAPAIRSLARLDAWADTMYREILRRGNPERNNLSTTIALYLYGRSFFLKDRPIAKEHAEANAYWLGQAKKYWLQLANRQGQAHLAIGLQRFGDKETPKGILASIKERSVSDEELGMFWRDQEHSHWWYHAPIETQAMMIEAFDEVANDPAAVEDCKVWMLKQKQTQNWKTTKATADAVYGLLLRGTDLLKSDALVEVTVGNMPIVPEKVEAGTGFYEEKFVRTEVKPEFGRITVKKADAGVSWGSVHWQYLEDVSKVTVHDGTPLKLEKKLFKRTFTKKGPVLEAVDGPLDVGDEVVVRVVLRTDRDMEYVHLKDHRGSGTEPVNVLSRYKYQDGLGYYESTKDTATHFFIDYLPKGTYVFEYPVRVQHRGSYPSGLASIQCMYAPEFNAHSESVPMTVK